jgi:hypothetical protein
MISRERLFQVNGVELCVETFGDPANPAILLVDGAGHDVPALIRHTEGDRP